MWAGTGNWGESLPSLVLFGCLLFCSPLTTFGMSKGASTWAKHLDLQLLEQQQACGLWWEIGLGVVQGERATPPFPVCQDLSLLAWTCWSRVSEEGASEACQALMPGLIRSHRLCKEDSQQGLTAPTFLCSIPSFLVHRVFTVKHRGRQCFYALLNLCLHIEVI